MEHTEQAVLERQKVTTQVSEGRAVGFVHFDKPGIKSNRVEALVVRENAVQLQRNKFVKIADQLDESRSFLGRVLEGPFFHPEEVGRDSALAQVSILHGTEFPAPPSYYAMVILEILGELSKDRKITSSTRRPAPQSKVLSLSPEDLRQMLALDEGDLLVGQLGGYPGVEVRFDSKRISVIPRNIGIFGTVGSGKTNTSQVLIEELARAGWAVIVLDVEGEYTEMDRENTASFEAEKLKELGLNPEGIKDFHVLKLAKCESTSPSAQDVTIHIDQIDPGILTELLEATEPQAAALIEIINELRGKRDDESEDDVLTPGKGKSIRRYTLEQIMKSLDSHIRSSRKRKGEDAEHSVLDALNVRPGSLYPLRRKLKTLRNTAAFDHPTAAPIDPDNLLKRGRVTVFDLSDTGDYEKNLLIAQLLERVFTSKKEDRERKRPDTIIFIEEAHSFISRENSDKMRETVNKLKEIARRGRKRWLSLCFISQQPSHIPNEIFELANTRIIHSIRSTKNLDVLRYSSGDVTDEMWDSVPGLGIGEALVNGPQFRQSLVLQVRFAKSKRRRLE